MKKNLLLNTIVLAVFGAAFTVQADIVTDWNTSALNAIRVGHTPPPKASRQLAILHASIFDALNGVNDDAHHYLVKPLKKKDAAATSAEAAATAAAHKIMLQLYPANAAAYDSLNNSILAGIANGPAKLNIIYSIAGHNFIYLSIGL